MAKNEPKGGYPVEILDMRTGEIYRATYNPYHGQVVSVEDYFCNNLAQIHDTPTHEIVEEMYYTQWYVPGVRDESELAELIDKIKAEHKAGTLTH